MQLTKLNIAIALAIAIALTGFLLSFQRAGVAEAAVFNATNIRTASTSAAFAITSSARVLATTTNPLDPANSYTRVYASICNPNATPVALNLDGDKSANVATGKVTTFIAAAAGYSVCYEITDRNQYSGSVTASSTNGTVNITVKDYVQ